MKELNFEQMAQVEGGDGCWGNVVAGAMIGGAVGGAGAAQLLVLSLWGLPARSVNFS
jgi:lactobin A/cerein 7B family class IIb bacteriocin